MARPRHTISELKTVNTKATDRQGRFIGIGDDVVQDKHETDIFLNQASERALDEGNLEAFEDIQHELKTDARSIRRRERQGNRYSSLLQDSVVERVGAAQQERRASKALERQVDSALTDLLRKTRKSDGTLMNEREINIALSGKSVYDKQSVIQSIVAQPNPQLQDIVTALQALPAPAPAPAPAPVVPAPIPPGLGPAPGVAPGAFALLPEPEPIPEI